MPWHIVEESSECPASKPYAVVKDADGSVAGCHATRADAEDQLAALYANEPAAARGAPFEFYSEDQPRDEQGRWGEGGASSSDKGEGPRTAEDIANAIARGEDVTLQANEVSMVLDKMAAMSREAKAAGEQAPTFDLCQATIPGTNLFCGESQGIERQDMPQIKGDPVPGSPADSMPRDAEGGVDATEAFKDALGEAGYSFERDTVPADTLKATQTELVGGKVGGIMGAIESGAYDLHQDPIFVSRDNYVLDGHHRWAAAVGAEYRDALPNNQITMDVIRVDAPILELVQFTNDFTKEIGIQQKSATASAWIRAVLSSLNVETATANLWLQRSPFFAFYSEDQARDERGRFGEGTAESISAVGGVQEWPIASMSVFPEDMRDKIMDNVHNRCEISDMRDVEQRFDQLMSNAMRDGNFEIGRTWYDREHEKALGIAEKHDVSMERACGALAAMSPGAVYEQEMGVLNTMMGLGAGNVELSQERLDLVNAKLEAFGYPGPISNGEAYGALDAHTAAVAMQSQHMEGEHETGWGVGKMGYDPYATAIEILRDDKTDTTLNGVKVREFYNNLSNPQLGDHVTIDVMMMRAATGKPEFSNDTRITGTPSKQVTTRDANGEKVTMKTGIGPTPAMADAVRNVAEKYNVQPNQAQAIIWTQWKAEHPPTRGGAV